ncbi:MAG: (2Fe-2S) ferredoxin domain-containing protein [Nitrospinae bacterium]|nr:(2Fe-2S) ferredoxin domain-containing protein [Nitrospinota bacterium]
MREKNVKICKGPGCKAWSSDRIARELREMGEALNLDDVRICRVPCMNACGGGASVRVGSRSSIVKFREVDEAYMVLDIKDPVIVAC